MSLMEDSAHPVGLRGALINIFLLTEDQMTACSEKGVIHSNEPTQIYHRLCFTEPFSVFGLIILIYCFSSM